VLNFFKDPAEMEAQASLTVNSMDFKNLLMGELDAATLLEDQRLTISGDPSRLLLLKELFDQFPRRFPLVTPRDQSMT